MIVIMQFSKGLLPEPGEIAPTPKSNDRQKQVTSWCFTSENNGGFHSKKWTDILHPFLISSFLIQTLCHAATFLMPAWTFLRQSGYQLAIPQSTSSFSMESEIVTPSVARAHCILGLYSTSVLEKWQRIRMGNRTS